MADNVDFFQRMADESAEEHARTSERLRGGSKPSSTRAVAQITMTKTEKERYRRIADAHSIRLSQMVRLALDYYIKQMGWDE